LVVQKTRKKEEMFGIRKLILKKLLNKTKFNNYGIQKIYKMKIQIKTLNSELMDGIMNKDTNKIEYYREYIEKQGDVVLPECAEALVDYYIELKDLPKARECLLKLERSDVIETMPILEKMIKAYLGREDEVEIINFVERMVLRKFTCSNTVKPLIEKIKNEELKQLVLKNYKFVVGQEIVKKN
jgi:hypothetical protein